MRTALTRLIPTLAVAAALTACGPTQDTTPSAVPQTPSSSPVSSSTEAPSASAPASPTTSSSAAVGQTDTEWGRIWDALPGGFPEFPGATIADDASGTPASGRFAVPGGDPQAIATWFQDALETATFSTIGLNGPAEDGSFVIDSVGDGECRLQTTITPQGDLTFISILYGADCPSP
jgi:hypothetical protein